MTTALYIFTFALGVTLGAYITYKFRKPTTVNEYSGTVKNKVRGRGNSQTNDNRAEINGGMSRREVLKILKSLKK